MKKGLLLWLCLTLHQKVGGGGKPPRPPNFSLPGSDAYASHGHLQDSYMYVLAVIVPFNLCHQHIRATSVAIV